MRHRPSLHSSGSDQRVAPLNRVALAVTSQVFSRATAYGGVYVDIEQSVECGIPAGRAAAQSSAALTAE